MAEAIQKVEAKVKTDVVQGRSSDSSTYGIFSLVFGGLSLFGICAPVCCVPFGIIGAILGYIGMNKDKNSSLSKIGLILSILGLVIGICGIIAGALLGGFDYSYNWNNVI